MTSRRNAEIRVLLSPGSVRAVVDALDPATVAKINGIDAASNLAPQRVRQDAVATVIDAVKVHAASAFRTMTLSYTGPDPAAAAAVVNRLVGRYLVLRRNDSTGVALTRLRREAEDARERMDRAKSRADTDRAAGEANAEREGTERLQRELATLRAQLTDPASDAAATALREQRGQLDAEFEGLQQRYGPRHPEVIAINARIAQVEEELTSETRRADVLIARARTVQSRAEKQMEDQAKVEARHARLADAARKAGRRYEALVADVRQAEAARPVPGGAHVIARATIPSAPDFPRPWPFAACGLLAALAAGSAVALVREALVPGFRTRAAAERRLGLPVIGMVPDALEIVGVREAGIDPGDLVVSHRQSSFAAAFKSIHVGLGFGSGAKSLRSVVISSAIAAEGKTTVSIGLARSAALAGLRVLLIDCDVRLPALSRALAPEAATGLADVLEGKVELRQALVRDIPSGAWVLAARHDGRPAAAGLVGSDAMERLLARIVGDYDLIVLDAAPALALAETAALARLADTVLLVARWRTTPIGATSLALDRLREAGARVSALALTRVSL